ncbi:hypothetical protein RHMOL_Rhmol11G0084100 [Rhododendron molle]|uniref:Uncharacterized protein n=1 Tax=Rhododendron molle TaxID=49168 RepID=A0ACC0LRJ8_RHOML|nr:hypothetical protein RHMOL_Rhmol11G0084100 [Rhododendron molle]
MLGLFSVFRWNIWKAQNEWVFNRVWVEESKVVADALAEFDEFFQANLKEAPVSQFQVAVPEHGYHQNRLLGLENMNQLGTVRRIEAVPKHGGFRAAVSTAISHGQNIVQMLQGKLSAKASLVVIITERLNLATLLNSCSFRFISPTCNRVAYVVVKYALSIEHPTNWRGDFLN